MPEKTIKTPPPLDHLSACLNRQLKAPSFLTAQETIDSVMALLNINSKGSWKPFADTQGKIRSNASWFMLAEGFADRRAAYKLAEENKCNLDLKAYWVQNISKSVISWLVALTPNFEDEPFYAKLNIGIDFIIPQKADRVFVVLSQNYVIRVLELCGALTVTQQEIFSYWLQRLDFSNKAQAHDTLWTSFDLQPVNKEFYAGISGFFVELRQHLVARKIFSDKEAALFANRLTGRLIFCWFLDKKDFLDKEQQYFETGKKAAKEYYEQKLEKLFFRTLNTKISDRTKDSFALLGGLDTQTPFLNGGLFTPRETDHFGEKNLSFPADYFDRLYNFLKKYNFTTDESTSTFQQVAIDPEMLGKIFENLLAEQTEETGEQARKAKGAFYTPREIVDYMCRESLRKYLQSKIPVDEVRDQRLGQLLDSRYHEFRDQQRNYRRDLQPYKYDILKALDSIKVVDPACGSGAFPMGMLHLLLDVYERLDPAFDPYRKKLEIVKGSIFGIDIDPMAVEIARLRAWLSIVVDESTNPKADNQGIEPLPNLDFKFVCANSLIAPPEYSKGPVLFEDDFFTALEAKADAFFTAASDKEEKRKQIEVIIEKKIAETLKELGRFSSKMNSDEKNNMRLHKRNKQIVANNAKLLDAWQSYKNVFVADEPVLFFETKYFFPSAKTGFDIVISNPPYVSTKGRSEETKKDLEANFGFVDDLYNHFYFKGIQLLKDGGILSYISSNTFWTIQTKKNLRELFLANHLFEIYDTANPFETPLVDTCVVVVQKQKEAGDYQVLFKDGREELLKPVVYKMEIAKYREAVNNVFFKPTPFNLSVYAKYNKRLCELLGTWWNCISTSKNIEKSRKVLDVYREKLKPGDITLLGLITDGGQGLATANNGKYVGVLEGTKYAENVRASRAEKLAEAVEEYKIKELKLLKTVDAAETFLSKKSEKQIRQLFDELKETYGRDIFGQGYLFRIVSPKEIADVEDLSDNEMKDGIQGDKTFVPYDKGDRDGNRWYLRTPYCIDWSRKNVRFFYENSGKSGEGMPVIRSPQFYFKKGFCWTNVLNPNARLIKCRLKAKTVNDVGSMALCSLMKECSDPFLVALLSSNFLFDYYRSFINQSVNVQINDIRQLPVIIPTSKQIKVFEGIFDEAYSIKEKQFDGKLSEEAAEKKLADIQTRLDAEVLKLYGLAD